ncbi:MAG TPA: hypothetical protein VEB59_10840, partial [Gemmatimonadales bacterium]|nr:hypothetical protein [Gemmatimonadales bacterium]
AFLHPFFGVLSAHAEDLRRRRLDAMDPSARAMAQAKLAEAEAQVADAYGRLAEQRVKLAESSDQVLKTVIETAGEQADSLRDYHAQLGSSYYGASATIQAAEAGLEREHIKNSSLVAQFPSPADQTAILDKAKDIGEQARLIAKKIRQGATEKEITGEVDLIASRNRALQGMAGSDPGKQGAIREVIDAYMLSANAALLADPSDADAAVLRAALTAAEVAATSGFQQITMQPGQYGVSKPKLADPASFQGEFNQVLGSAQQGAAALGAGGGSTEVAVGTRGPAQLLANPERAATLAALDRAERELLARQDALARARMQTLRLFDNPYGAPGEPAPWVARPNRDVVRSVKAVGSAIGRPPPPPRPPGAPPLTRAGNAGVSRAAALVAEPTLAAAPPGVPVRNGYALVPEETAAALLGRGPPPEPPR